MHEDMIWNCPGKGFEADTYMSSNNGILSQIFCKGCGQVYKEQENVGNEGNDRSLPQLAAVANTVVYYTRVN